MLCLVSDKYPDQSFHVSLTPLASPTETTKDNENPSTVYLVTGAQDKAAFPKPAKGREDALQVIDYRQGPIVVPRFPTRLILP